MTKTKKTTKAVKKQDPKPAAAPASLVGKIPHIKAGVYKDGMPYPDFNYLAFKLSLKSNRLISRDSMFEFAKLVKGVAKKLKIDFDDKGFKDKPVTIREIIFVDTQDFKLYNNSFILRRRIAYEHGFPVGDPEIVFKFRNTDLQRTAEADVRPLIQGAYQVKFKCQVTPLKDRLGGTRVLYSSNVQFPRKYITVGTTVNDNLTFDTVTKVFPELGTLKAKKNEQIDLVNEAIVEEVLQDVGELDFGDGNKIGADVGIWRTRGEHRPLIGEFSFSFKFKNRKDLKPEIMKRVEEFYLALQFAAKEWISLSDTKTGVVYRMLAENTKSDE